MAELSSPSPSVHSFQFLSCLQTALLAYGFSEITLKAKQVICLEHLFLKKDLVAVLPTGYGKSIVFQILPRLLKERDSSALSSADDTNTRSIVIVISPLNALMRNQIEKLGAIGVEAAVLGVRERKDEEGNRLLESEWQGVRSKIVAGEYDIVFSHPEAFLSTKEGLEVLQSDAYRSAVKAVVVDEAHCILEWGKDFRPDYGKLSVLAALFPNAPVAALTATATKKDREVIVTTLCLKDAKKVIGNLDRVNIFYEKIFREGSSDTQAYVDILKPIAEGLLKQGTEYPLHVIYLSLPWCGRAYKLFESVLKERQYSPVTGPAVPKNRLFGQFHAPQTEKMKDSILKQLCSPQSKCRVVFATVAMGMGVDIPSVRQVIHIGPPRTVREYCQETGRAGRDRKPSRATLYYNNRDIAQNKPGMTDNMRTYCKSTGICLRKQLLSFLDAPTVAPGVIPHSCCDVCSISCLCRQCKDDKDKS